MEELAVAAAEVGLVVVASQEEAQVDEEVDGAALLVAAVVDVVEAAVFRVAVVVAASAAVAEVTELDRTKLSARHDGRRRLHLILLVLARAHRYLDHSRRLVLGGSCTWKAAYGCNHGEPRRAHLHVYSSLNFRCCEDQL